MVVVITAMESPWSAALIRFRSDANAEKFMIPLPSCHCDRRHGRRGKFQLLTVRIVRHHNGKPGAICSRSFFIGKKTEQLTTEGGCATMIPGAVRRGFSLR